MPQAMVPGRLLLPRCPPPHPTPSLPCFSCFSAKPWLAPCQPLSLLVFFVDLDVSCIDLPHIFLHFSTFDSFQQSHNKYCHVGTFAHTQDQHNFPWFCPFSSLAWNMFLWKPSRSILLMWLCVVWPIHKDPPSSLVDQLKVHPSLACFLSSLFGTGWLFEVFVNISFLLCCVIIKHVAGHKKVIIVQFRLLTRPDTEKSNWELFVQCPASILPFPQLVTTMSCFNKHQSVFYYPVNAGAKEDSNISKCRHTLGLCSHWNALSVWIRGDFKPMQQEQFNDNDDDCGKDNDNGPLGRPRTQSETIVSKVDCFFAIAASHYSCYYCYCCQWWWFNHNMMIFPCWDTNIHCSSW